jgi:hypothetical protein
VGGDGALHVDGGGHARPGGGEHGEEPVTLGAHLAALMGPEGATDQAMVVVEDTGVGVLAQPPE